MSPARDPTGDVPALVLGSGVTALGVVRSLGRAGIPLYLWSHADDLAARSRWSRRLPGLEGGGALPGDLEGTLTGLDLERAVLMPGSDAAALAVSRLPAELAERFPASVCRPDMLARLMDKEGLAHLLRAEGVPHPRTHFLQNENDLKVLPEEGFQNAFLKPRDSQRFFRTFGRKAFRVEGRSDALTRYREIQGHGLSMILQEYVPGPATSHIFLDGFRDRRGRLVHLFARRRLRMHPPDFGNSTLMVSVPAEEVQPAVASLERILEATDYRGIFSAEFKQDERDGAFRLLEVNCRAWWYIEFADRCGARIATAAYRDALALPPAQVEEPRVGVRCVYPAYDLDAFRSRRGSDDISALRWFRPWLGAMQAVFVWDDPRPVLSVVREKLGRLVSRTRSAVRRSHVPEPDGAPISASVSTALPSREQSPGRVLVLDGDQISTLAVVRSMGRMGHSVVVGASSASAVAFTSRYCRDSFVYPDPMVDPDGFRTEVLRQVGAGAYELVIPVTDRTIVPLMEIREQVEDQALLAMASSEALDVVLSKERTTELAESLGVPVPRSTAISERSGEPTVPWEATFPLVVKPDRSKVWDGEAAADGQGQDLQVEYAVDPADFRTRASTLLESTSILVQEAVEGVGVGLGVMARDGELLYAFQYRRLHEVPLTGGASSYRVSEALDPELVGHARRMLRALSWDGVAMFEFKRASSDPGRHWLMEVNGRFWGSLALAVASGADFPRFLSESLLSGRQNFPQEYEVGRRARNLNREVSWWKAILRPSSDLTGLVTYPSLGRVTWDAVRTLNPAERWDTLSLDDPRPFFSEVAGVLAENVAMIRERLRIRRTRRQMHRHRIRPDAVREALGKAQHIHFVCHGNIIRSVYAERLLRTQIHPDAEVHIDSSGLQARPDRTADPRARQVATERGIDLSGHRSRNLSQVRVPPETVVFAMEAKQVVELRRRLGSTPVPLYLLGCLADDGDIEIPDPFTSRDIGEFEARFDQIDEAVARIAAILGEPGLGVGVQGDSHGSKKGASPNPRLA